MCRATQGHLLVWSDKMFNRRTQWRDGGVITVQRMFGCFSIHFIVTKINNCEVFYSWIVSNDHLITHFIGALTVNRKAIDIIEMGRL